MRLIKIIGPVAWAAVIAMALIGASIASAEGPTQLCKVHTGLTCPEGEETTSVHMALEEGTVGRVLAVTDVLCLGVLLEAEVLGKGNPQVIHTTNLTFTGCGTTSAHSNCKMTVKEQSSVNLLKTGLDEGYLEATSGYSELVCSNLGIECKYDAESVSFAVKAQHLEANEAPSYELGGKFFCPDEGLLDGLLKTLVNSYITGEKEKPLPYTALCKTHNSKGCDEKDQVKSLHMVTTKPPVLYNTIANIECESSLGTATVLELGEPQKLDVTELTWKDCHTQGAADNCTVTSKGLPTLDLKRTALNVGEATTLGLKVGIDCTVLGLIELECTSMEATLPCKPKARYTKKEPATASSPQANSCSKSSKGEGTARNR